MKKKALSFLAISALAAIVCSCTEKYYTLDTKVEIVNHSSSQVAGSLNMGTNPFELDPGESFTLSVKSQSKEKSPDASSVSVMGPRELMVDGKRYTLKPSVNAKDFIDLIGWKVTTKAEGFVCEFEFTDESLARMLTMADPL
ncbi:MAG: hypothetical protein J5374_08815 [Bacteroidales bacterium]|nr:hypothetical protein [Bacteroidales bacterium]